MLKLIFYSDISSLICSEFYYELVLLDVSKIFLDKKICLLGSIVIRLIYLKYLKVVELMRVYSNK
ncbi:hypothetical protein A1OE_83 [Candidatus Endolissoclinum faulkneri L2]|uniref:Uncharacterized protein n=1 Tax=Candidatus Endolissoclinum faulkneri L2 TaxID=1193729 RepID=K7ZC49_9PROT|nr:hypothetical protein A1OE_83 [Candidatus Endolissoclinum faulkneri L2]